MENAMSLPCELGQETKDILSRRMGIPFDELVKLTPDEADALVCSKIGHMPVYGKKRDSRKIARGNPLLARRKIKTLEDLENDKDVLKWLRKF